MGETETVPVWTSRDLAKRYGIGESTARAHVKRGYLEQGPSGHVLAESAIRFYEGLQGRKVVEDVPVRYVAPGTKARGTRPRGRIMSTPELQASFAPYRSAKEAREAYQAQLLRLELARKQGEVVDVETARGVLVDLVGTLAHEVLQVPEVILPQLLAATPKGAELAEVIRAELQAAIGRARQRVSHARWRGDD